MNCDFCNTNININRLEAEANNVINDLLSISNELQKVTKDCAISNTVAASAEIAGGVLAGIGAILLPVTFGASSALIATGGGIAATGGVVGIGTDATCYSILKPKLGRAKNRIEKFDISLEKYQNLINSVVEDMQENHIAEEASKWLQNVLSVGGIGVAGNLARKGRKLIKANFIFNFKAGNKLITKSAGAFSKGVVGLSVVAGIWNIINNAKTLKNGDGKANQLRRVAESIKEKIQELEEKSKFIEKYCDICKEINSQK